MVLFRVLYTELNNADSSAVIMVFMKKYVCVWKGLGGGRGTGCSNYWCFHLLMFGIFLKSCHCNTNMAGGDCCQVQAWWFGSRHKRLSCWCLCLGPCASGAGPQCGLTCKLPDSLVCISSCFITPTIFLTTVFSLISTQSASLGPTCFLIGMTRSRFVLLAYF